VLVQVLVLAGNTTTLGRIGTGFMYADWKSQIAYSSPNWNGLRFTVGVTQAWNALERLCWLPASVLVHKQVAVDHKLLTKVKLLMSGQVMLLVKFGHLLSHKKLKSTLINWS
jgi:hypothetical protein